MKRKGLIILLAMICIVCCAFALSACGNSGGGNNSGDTDQTDPNGGTISGSDENCEHKWSSWSTVSEATCTEKGSEERTCSVCGGKETKEIPALGHVFGTDNVCTRCGFELKPTVGLEYELINDTSSYYASSYYTVTGLGNADAKEIVIPAYHAGKTVKKIADEAFYGSDYITSVYLPGTINEIGKEAFYWCENLSELTISKPTDYSLIINEQAFYGCTKLKNISLPDVVTEIYSNSFENTGYYKDKNNWKNGALFLCGWLLTTDSAAPTELTLDSSAKGIANNALSNSNITKIIIETSIKCIEKSFANCKITSATIADRDNLIYLPKKQITELNIISDELYENDLNGFGYLQKLTVPSLLIHERGSSRRYNAQLHYLFGQAQYEGAVEVIRGYYNKNNYETESKPYYIPSSLCEITVLSGAIPDCAFSGILSLNKFNIGSSVTSLGKYICKFSNENVIFNFVDVNSFLNVDKVASNWCAYSIKHWMNDDVNSGIYTLGDEYFKITLNNNIIVDFNLPDGTTKIKDYTFCSCTSLESITIPNSVTSIGKNAFCNCTSLESITIPNSVTSIGNNAFYYCTNLKSIYITDFTAWCNIFDCSFPPLSNEYNLYLNNEPVTEITANMLKGVTEIKSYAFLYCASLKSITIADYITSIGDHAFEHCTNLKSVNFSNNSKLTSIGDWAFEGCTSLESITIPNSVASIGYGAFKRCTKLTSITIPDSVTSIGAAAFEYCTSLTSVTFNNTVGWKVSLSSNMSNAISVTVTDPTQNAEYFRTYLNYYWRRE